MEQLLIHFVGDYWFQSPWMAINKSKKTFPCFIHCLIYTSFFALLTTNFWALLLIFGAHFLIDRFSLPKYFIWIKNHLNPALSYFLFDNCRVTGYYDTWITCNEDSRSPYLQEKFLSTLIYIVTDNSIHLVCNYFILKHLG